MASPPPGQPQPIDPSDLEINDFVSIFDDINPLDESIFDAVPYSSTIPTTSLSSLLDGDDFFKTDVPTMTSQSPVSDSKHQQPIQSTPINQDHNLQSQSPSCSTILLNSSGHSESLNAATPQPQPSMPTINQLYSPTSSTSPSFLDILGQLGSLNQRPPSSTADDQPFNVDPFFELHESLQEQIHPQGPSASSQPVPQLPPFKKKLGRPPKSTIDKVTLKSDKVKTFKASHRVKPYSRNLKPNVNKKSPVKNPIMYLDMPSILLDNDSLQINGLKVPLGKTYNS